MKPSHLLTTSLLIAGVFLSSCSRDEPVQLGREEQFKVTGTITGSSVEGVIVSAGDQQGTSNAQGEYGVPGLTAGNYQVTPSKSGYYFVPEARMIEIVDEDTENVDFEIFSEDELQYNGEAWQLFNSEVYTIKENEGSSIQLDLAQNALWFQDDQGGLIYRLVTGDFILEGRVSVRKRTNDQEEVECSICLGGLMARNPESSTGENYVHLVTGNTPEGIGVEHKSTVDGQSDFDATNDGSADFELRVVRSGSDFVLSKRAPNANDWVEVITYNRPDLPNILQVGFNIYTAASGSLADLSVIYENVTISQ